MSSTLSLPASARIVVVADTHSKPHAAIRDRLLELKPAAILHAGDIGDLAVLDMLAQYAPVLAVRGNIDAVSEVPEQRLVDITAGQAALRILLLHIAVYGPRLRADVGRSARSAGASLVVCGHSHVPFMGAEGGVTVFNPGSIGPRRFQLPIVLGVIEMAATAVRLRHIDCETGREWTPDGGGPDLG